MLVTKEGQSAAAAEPHVPLGQGRRVQQAPEDVGGLQASPGCHIQRAKHPAAVVFGWLGFADLRGLGSQGLLACGLQASQQLLQDRNSLY